VLGLLRIALAWIPALCVNAQYPLHEPMRLCQADEERSDEDVRDWVHEGDVDLDGLGDQVLDLTEHGEVVLGFDVFGVGGIEAGDEATERSDTDTLTNTENSYIVQFNTSFIGER
jgi:hypothetical protein